MGGGENLCHLAAAQDMSEIFELVFKADKATAHKLLEQPLARYLRSFTSCRRLAPTSESNRTRGKLLSS